MAVRTSLLEPVRTSLLSYPVPRTTLTPPFPVPQPSAPPPRIMPLTPETEEEWYQVFPSQVDPKVNLSRGGVWMPDRHGQWWPVYPDDPPDILIQCAIGKIWRCRHRQCVRLDPARHPRPKPSSTNLRQPTLTGRAPPQRPTIVPRPKKAVRSADRPAPPRHLFKNIVTPQKKRTVTVTYFRR